MKEWIIVGALLKVLLFPAYHSTDFDVHRNWLAITNNLPLKEWYFNSVSQWTLDYPPFFAYFEYLLSLVVPQSVKNDGCLDIVAVGNYGWPTVVFQRTSVLISELVLGWSLWELQRVIKPTQKAKAIAAIIWFNPGWLILDHIHFQYNAAMFGVFVASMVAVYENRHLKCAALFATLLCFKHIYLYVAPAYFAYLLRAYIFANNRINVLNTIKLGASVLAPFAVAFAPFYDHIPQLLSRLFPFSRGLTHAYWAPNFWALYSFADRVLGLVRGNASDAGTRGLVGQVSFSNLPDIEPIVPFVLTLVFQIIFMGRLISRKQIPSPSQFVACVTLCGMSSFLFGWHVHEKAVMVVLVPFALLSLENRGYWTAFAPLLSAGTISLFPLIYTPAETILKYAYTVTYLIVCLFAAPELAPPLKRVSSPLLARLVMLYHFGFAPVLLFGSLVNYIAPRFEYAGLMMLSVYSAAGVLLSFGDLAIKYIFLQ